MMFSREKTEASGPVLVGLAIDVSASMRTSIANETDGDLSRLDSLRGAIRDVARQARSTFGPGDAGPGAILNVFAYAFGLTHLPVAVCDFLSLSKAASRFHLAGETPAQHAATRDPHAAIGDIAQEHGRAGWREWVARHLTADEAHQLLANLRQYPALASRLKDILPEVSAGEADLVDRVSRDKGAQAVGTNLVKGLFSKSRRGESLSVGFDAVRLAFRRSEIEKAGRLVRALASAPLDQVLAEERELFELLRTEVGRTLVDEMARLGDTTVAMSDVPSLLNVSDDGVMSVEDFIYGRTPMCEALQLVAERFQRESTRAQAPARSILFLVSDGESTDGNPSGALKRIRSMGVTVVCCYVTNSDVLEPRRLLSSAAPDWDLGARSMFSAASRVEARGEFVKTLKAHGWHVPNRARYFVQLNHSTLLSEFLTAVLPRPDPGG